MIQPKVGLLVLLNYILTMYPDRQRMLSPLLFKTLPHTVLPGPAQSAVMHRLDFVSSRTITYAVWKVAILLLRHGLASDFSGLLSLISSTSPLGRQPLDSDISMSVSNTTQLLGIFDLGHLLDSRVF